MVHLEEMLGKLTENLNETAESIIKDLTMLNQTIAVNDSKKLDKDYLKTVPTAEDRQMEILNLVNEQLNPFRTETRDRIDKTNDRIARLKKDIGLDDLKMMLKKTVSKVDFETENAKLKAEHSELD